MASIDKFVEILPDIIMYIVSGFIYITTFKYVRYSKYNKNTNMIAESLVIGFVLRHMIGKIFQDGKFNTIFFLTSCVVIGYFSAKLVDSKFILKILKLIHIYKTPNEYVWSDIFDAKMGMTIMVYDKETAFYYVGVIALIEEFVERPLIVLSRYTVYDKDSNVIETYENDPNVRITIDTSKFSVIKLFYHKGSKVTEDTVKAISKNKK